MRNKFLRGVIKRSEEKFRKSTDKITASILFNATELYIKEQKKILTAYCNTCYTIERYQQLEVVDGILNCSKCNSDIILDANNVVYNNISKFKFYKERHSIGFISIENIPTIKAESDLGIQIAEDGRVWICIDGVSFMRFKPRS